MSLTALRRRLRPRTRMMELRTRLVRSRLGVRPIQNLLLDLRFGGRAGGVASNPFAAQGASRVQSTDYAALTRVHRRNGIEIAPSDVLVDLGCGRGRVINWWLSQGMRNRMTGVELVPGVAEETRRRLVRFPNVTIVCGDATTDFPDDATFFYMYNPFDETCMRRLAANLVERSREPERLRILYFNALHAGVFEAADGWRVRPLDTGEPESAVLVERTPPG